MDDERKRPPRGKPARSTGAPGLAKGGDGGKFRKHDGPKPFQKRGDGKPFAKKPFSKSSDRPRAAEDGERKPFVRREAGSGDGKPFRKPYSKPSGDRPPREASERSERKPFVRREEGDGENKPFRKPFVRREDSGGDKPFRKPYSKPYSDRAPRDASDRGARKPFVRREESDAEGKPFRKPSGDRPPRDDARPRSAKPFGKPGGDRPARSFSGDRRSEDRTEAVESGERIAKRLARAGIASRRDAEELIAAGRIRVNGKVLESPAYNVLASDRIELDGEDIPAPERTRLFLFNKPAGLVTTNRDPEGRRTVFDVLPEGLPRLMTVGRLDINTEGLLLLTNDGGLSRVMELPATGWLRRYRVRVHGTVEEKALADLRDGVAVDGVFYGAIEAQLDRAQGTNAWLTIGLREGKNREVKNVLGSLGLDVTRLIRISYGPFQLGELPEGHVMEIKGRTLREQLGERLIEEAGANFDADIAMPFPNRPVRRGYERDAPAVPSQPPRPKRERLQEGEGGLIKNFRRDRDRKREDNLDRWSTSRDGDAPRFKKRDDAGAAPRKSFGDKPKFGDKPRFGGKGKPDEREEAPQASPRRANVWMAPGAKPQGKRPSERAADKRTAEGRPPRKSGDRPFGGSKSGPRSGSGKPGGPPRGGFKGGPKGGPRGGRS